MGGPLGAHKSEYRSSRRLFTNIAPSIAWISICRSTAGRSLLKHLIVAGALAVGAAPLLPAEKEIAVGLVELLIMGVMVLFNGVFAGYEIALASVTIARLQVLVRENRAGAKAALYMKQNMEASLAAVQVAITLLGASAAAIGGAGAAESIQAVPAQRSFGLSSGRGAGPGHCPASWFR